MIPINNPGVEVKTTERKLKIFGLVMLILISIFCFAVVSIFNSKNQDKQDEINSKAEKREAAAITQRDKYSAQNLILTNKVSNIEKDVKDSRARIINIQSNYQKSQIEIQKLKNEKNYIPNNATLSEQSTFLSGYKYKPY